MKDEKRSYLSIKVHPRSRKQDITRIDAKTYKVRVLAPPSKGEANTEVVKIIATHFGLPVSFVEIVRGHTSRNKVVAIMRKIQE
ncbi:DUF167 domain-containing protein [Acidobacteriota bacterium]